MTAIAVHTATYLDEREGAMVVLLISNCNTPFYSFSINLSISPPMLAACLAVLSELGCIPSRCEMSS